MLLLVIDAKLNQRCSIRRERGIEQTVERCIDKGTIGAHLLRRWPRQQSTLRTRLPRAHALVIGIEAVFEALVEDAIAREEALENERLEEPGGVCEMPLGRARIVHDLDDLVLVAQGARKLGGERAGRKQAIAQGERFDLKLSGGG